MDMSLRRLERAVLATPFSLKAVTRLNFRVTADCRKFTDFRAQFLPLLRYHNPKLVWEVDSSSRAELILTFSDNSQDTVPLDDDKKVVQSHHLMEILMHQDALKHALKDKYTAFSSS